ncbi:MAG: PGF-pre-PGF domain-containing protein, partial [Candidatus Micrarchaeaceae archaeon]
MQAGRLSLIPALAIALALLLYAPLSNSSTYSTQNSLSQLSLSNSIAIGNQTSGTQSAQVNNLITNFTAIGLPYNATWNISYDNITVSTNSITASFSTPPGNYTVSVQNYTWKANNGTIIIHPNVPPTPVKAGDGYIIYFNASISFYQSGLPKNSTWVVSYGGVTKISGAASPINFSTQCVYCNTTYLVDLRSYGGIIYKPSVLSGLLSSNKVYVNFSIYTNQSSAASTNSTSTSSTVPTTSTTATTSAASTTSVSTTESTSSTSSTISQQIISNYTSIRGVLIPTSLSNSKTSLLSSFEASLQSQKGSPSGYSVALNYTLVKRGANITEYIIGYSSPNKTSITQFATRVSLINKQNFTYADAALLEAGVFNPFVVNDNASAFSSLYVAVTSNFTNASLNITRSLHSFSSTKPLNLPTYEYIHLSSSISDQNIRMAKYEFWVNDTWINSLSISPSQVALYKYINGSWVQLPTAIIASSQSAYEYAAISDSFSNYVISYSTGAVAGDSNPETLVLPSGYSLYLCGAAGNYTLATRGTVTTWTASVTATSPSSPPIDASIGYQTSDTCSAYTTGATKPGIALAGIGVPVKHYSVYTAAGNSTSSDSLSYTVALSGAFTVIIAVGGYYRLTSVSVPAGCAKQQYINNTDGYESAYVAVCTNQSAGSYSVSTTSASSGASAIAAYVFNPYKVTFDDVPTSGNVTTNGVTYPNGATANLIGTGAITANPPPNFKFSHWVSSNSNITLQNPDLQSTGITVLGNGTVTAYYNGTTTFKESGLPIVPVIPTSVEYYANVTLNNSQPVNIQSPFQQMVTVNSLAYQSYEAPNLQNVEFFYPNGTIIPSWLQSGNSSASTNTIYWLKISGGIPANTLYKIFMGFSAPTINLFNNVTVGEAPNLSSAYGKYDDGANVFNYYYNFAGTKLSRSFSSYIGNGTINVSNGLHISIANNGCTGTWGGIIYNTPLDLNQSIVEVYSNGIRSSGPSDVGIYTGNSDTAGGYAGVADTGGWGYGAISTGYTTISVPADITSGAGVASIYWLKTGEEGVGWQNAFVSSTNANEIWSQSLYPAIQAGECDPGANLTYNWFRIRAYPPNGVMPKVSITSSVYSSSHILNWNVTFNGVVNSSTTSQITFFGPYNTYPFTVSNQILNGVVYIPHPSSGSAQVGNVINIIFSPVGILSLSIESPSAVYDTSDKVTATAPSPSD